MGIGARAQIAGQLIARGWTCRHAGRHRASAPRRRRCGRGAAAGRPGQRRRCPNRRRRAPSSIGGVAAFRSRCRRSWRRWLVESGAVATVRYVAARATQSLKVSHVRAQAVRDTFGRARLSFASEADIDEFADVLGQFERGEITPEQWRVFRLVRGTYGQRQVDDAQMIRVKIPQGVLDRRAAATRWPMWPSSIRAASATSPPGRTCSSIS